MRRNIWESRRAKINHDWLKNRFLQALGAAIESLTDDDDLSYAFDVLDNEVNDWWLLRDELEQLLESFYCSTSPMQYLDEHPLNKIDDATREVLKGLVHDAWLVDRGLREWIVTTTKTLEKTNSSCEMLLNVPRNGSLNELRQTLCCLLTKCQSDCTDLSLMLGAVPTNGFSIR